jgi:hypothetical protein
MHDCLKNKPIQKREQMRKRFWLFAKRLKIAGLCGFSFFAGGHGALNFDSFFQEKE